MALSHRGRGRTRMIVALASLASAAAAAGQSRSPSVPTPVRVVRIAAASDLRFALDDIVGRWREIRADITLKVTYGSSGTFFAQLLNGAPFDLFMSADIDYPRQLTARGLTLPGSGFTYGTGLLVLWTPAASPLNPQQGGWQVLLDRRVMHVSIANPATAPYGRAAVAAMRGAGVYDRVKDRLVLGESVAQAFQFVESGAADVGVVALSLAMAPPVKDRGRYWQVPVDTYPRLDQGGVILKSAGDVDAARRVRTFLTSGAGRAVLARHGFVVPGQ